MLIRDILIEALTSCGWEPLDAPADCDARLTLGRSEGRVELAHHPTRRALRLTLKRDDGDGDERVLELRYGHAIDVVVDKLVAMQHELAFERHEANLAALRIVCDVTLAADPKKFFSMELRIDDTLRAQLDALAQPRRD